MTKHERKPRLISGQFIDDLIQERIADDVLLSARLTETRRDEAVKFLREQITKHLDKSKEIMDEAAITKAINKAITDLRKRSQ